MGERYQIHIKINYENIPLKDSLISIHLQWCWGHYLIKNLNRLLTTLEKTECKYPNQNDLKEYIKGVLVVNKSLEGVYYPYSIHLDSPYNTYQGDSNHGWCVVEMDITEKGKFKVYSKFYDTNGKIKTNKDLLKDCEKEWKNYEQKDKDKIKKLLNCGLFNNTKKDLQKIFNNSIKELVVEAI